MMLIPSALILIVTCDVALGRDAPYNYSLDMALNSVDDQYDGCSQNMTHLVQTCYQKKEIRANRSGFGKAWRDGEKNHSEPQDNLTKNHSIAIYVYTGSKVHSEFNNAVRNGKQAYKQLAFQWYSLYFWLTEALQILKKTQKKCKLSYRGTNAEYRYKALKKELRFGSFASSSLVKSETKKFGNRSCFEIYTCHGADVTKYSKHPREKEVLIPPYEKFIITDVRNGQKGDWCKTVYMLNSSGIQSNLNCAVAHHKCPSLSRNYMREGQITARRAILSDPQNNLLVKSKGGDKQMSRMLRVQQRDNKILQKKDRMSDFVRKN